MNIYPIHKRSFVLPEALIFFVLVLQILCLPALAGINASDTDRECAFCSEHVISSQQYYESAHFRVLYCYKPILKGHTLLIPIRHITRIDQLNSEEVVELQQVLATVQHAFLQVYGTDQYLFCCQNGPNAGQTVDHVHFHLIPREEKNLWTKIKLWAAMLGRPLTLQMTLSSKELQEVSKPLEEACATYAQHEDYPNM